MRLEIDIPEHHYNNIMAIKSINIGRAPYKGIVMYAINAIKHGKVLEQEPTTKKDCNTCTHNNETDGSNCYECVKDMCNNYDPTTKNDLGDDAVSRDVVKKYIQAHIHEIITESGEDKNGNTNRVLRSMIHGVNCMPPATPQEPRWIPVSERLPEEFETVILSTDKDEVFPADYLGKMNDGADCFDDNNGMDWEGNVIAWMPLPKQYEPKESEDKE